MRPSLETGPAAERLPTDPSRASIRYATLALVVVLCAGFLALGVWQLERRTWKLALIARVDERVHALAVDAPGRDRWPSVDAADDEYRHVRVRGRFVDDRATRVLAVTEYGRGSWLLVPLRSDDGDVVLVNRGFVSGPAPAYPPAARSGEPVEVTGLLRLSEPHGSVLHANDPAHDRWYSRDVEAIARARGLSRVAPFFVDADAAAGAGPPPGPEPIGGLTVIAFRNDHLVYALTWFVLATLCGWAARRLLRMPARRDEEA